MRAVWLLVFLLVPLASMAQGSSPVTVTEVVVGPPGWYRPIEDLNEPGFEHGWTGWEWSGSAEPDFHNPRSGVMNALICEEQGPVSKINQPFNIGQCRDGEPIWFQICESQFTNEGRPPDEDYTDIMEIWIADSQNLSYVTLALRYDVDGDGTDNYDCWYVRVDGMTEIGMDWFYHIGCDTNLSDLSPTVWTLDDLNAWCWHEDTNVVFLPYIRR